MIIIVESRIVYGVPKTYPVNHAAKTLAALTGKKTLDRRDLELAKDLGHTIEVQGYVSEELNGLRPTR
jgi:hypothetical protein